MAFISDKTTWTIFHPENCLAGMQLLALPVIIPRNWPLKRPQLALIMLPLVRFLKRKQSKQNFAQTWRF